MSALITIQQGTPNSQGRRSKKSWCYWNTDLDDETRLIEWAFLPLIENIDSLLEYERKDVESAITTFFTKGTFLSTDQIVDINSALNSLGYKSVELVNNGEYFQPVASNKSSPDATSWRLNAEARVRELELAIERYNAGKINLDRRKTTPLFEIR